MKERQLKIEVETQKDWNNRKSEEMVKSLAAQLVWFVPAFTFFTYLICWLTT